MEKHNKIEFGIEFLIYGAKVAFAELKQAFITALILHHLNQKYHAEIETDILDNVKNRKFS